jgi:uncharacterized membrane protein YhaH (DUF805 family)
LIIFVVLNVLLNGMQFTAEGLSFSFAWTVRVIAAADFTSMPPLVHLNFLAGNPVVSGILFALAVLVWLDLIVRRRHDRGRSGIDGLIWMALLVASQVAWVIPSVPPSVAGWLNLLVYAGAIYLFVVLVILPGNRGENRYGPVPRPD